MTLDFLNDLVNYLRRRDNGGSSSSSPFQPDDEVLTEGWKASNEID